MRVAEYDPGRRAELADLFGRVWGERPDERELEWFLERNPVRPASVLLAEEDGRIVATVAMAFQRMAIDGDELEVGMPLRVATDSAYRGRGIFATLQAANEERARDLGIRLLLTVPNAASTSVFLDRLAWQPLPRLRVWASLRLGRAPHPVERFRSVRSGGEHNRVLRDDDWLNWRFADSPRPYTLLQEDDAYGAAGAHHRTGVVAVAAGISPIRVARAARRPVVVALPPPWEHGRYARSGFVPSPKTFTLLGKALVPGQRVPDDAHFELGDLDFL